MGTRRPRWARGIGAPRRLRRPIGAAVQHAVKELSRWLQALRETDYIAAKRLVKFLMHSHEVAMTITPEQGRDWRVSSASDSDWAGCMASRRSTSGALVRLNGAVFSAVCRNQTVLAMSSSEAEFYACCVALTEAKYVQALMSDWGAETAAVSHFTDSSSAIVHASRIGLGGLRHMELKFLWVQREAEEGRVRVKKVTGFDNTTDVATKHVDAATLAHCQVALGLIVFAG